MKGRIVYSMSEGVVFSVLISDVFEFWGWVGTLPSGQYALFQGDNFLQYFAVN
jgi:hypothetical protein